MKKIILTILALIILLQPFSKMWVYVSFKINQNYIAQNLCENRTKPAMRCGGNCLLMRKLKKVDNDDQKQTKQNLKQKVEVLFCNNLLFSKNQNLYYFISKPSLNSNNKNLNPASFYSKVYQPPKNYFI